MTQTEKFSELMDLAGQKATSINQSPARAFFTACQSIKGSRAEYCETLTSAIERQRKVLAIRFAIASILMLGLFACATFVDNELLNTTSMQFLLSGAIVVSVFFFLYGAWLSFDISDHEEMLSYFKPLNSNPEHCFKLKKISESIPDVASYVKCVVGAHEELTLGDFKVACALEIGAEKKEAANNGNQACRELHALAG